jgi:hypothetical protein
VDLCARKDGPYLLQPGVALVINLAIPVTKASKESAMRVTLGENHLGANSEPGKLHKSGPRRAAKL